MNLATIEDVILYGNNKMSIALIKNVESQHRIKQINVQYYYIRELINKREFIIKWIPRSKILADRMTNSLLAETFRKHQALLEMAIK